MRRQQRHALFSSLRFFFFSFDHTSCCGMCGRRKKLRCFPFLSLRSLAWEEERTERHHHHLPPPFSRKLRQKKNLSLSSKGKEEEKSISSRQLPPACQRGRRQSVASKVFLWKVLCVLKRETKCGFAPPPEKDATYSGFPPKKRKAISDIWGGPPPPIKSLSFCESAVGDKESFGNFLATYTTFPFPLNCWRVKKILRASGGAS